MKRNAGIISVVLALVSGLLAGEFPDKAVNLTPREQEIIAASKADDQGAPRFNGLAEIGVHPGMAMLQAVAVSGSRPITFSAKNLPDGIHLDEHTGILAGSLAGAGQFVFSVIAQNSKGTTGRKLRIIAGDTLAQTPPMGWNSYDAFGDSVTEAETLANAAWRSEEHTSELQSHVNLVCRLLLEKKK